MRTTTSWLSQFVKVDNCANDLVGQLTMAGLEVENFTPVAPNIGNVIIGKVLTVAPHPSADRLHVCRVDIGADQSPIQIVCGAPNVRPELIVPVALPGADLPGGLCIQEAQIRGVASQGMLCSPKELGVDIQTDGLWELPSDLNLGVRISEALDLNDVILELKITPNRADCLSVRGLAREISAINGSDIDIPTITPVLATHSDNLHFAVHAPKHCPKYVGRVIKNLNSKAVTPFWLAERLRRAGIRSISAPVDVTNYVMLELGQPLHAFDLNRLEGSIAVRLSCEGEAITLLGDHTIQIAPNTLVIADDVGPVALAGVMGGLRAAVSENTKDIFLECAFFEPALMMGTARRYGLNTDSSFRFERGVDPQLQVEAIERATHLLVDIAGGEPGEVTQWCSDDFPPQPETISLRKHILYRTLGIAIDDTAVEQILNHLGMQVSSNQGGWMVYPPTFRFDISIEADLVEEIGRIYGYDKIPLSTLRLATQVAPANEATVSLTTFRSLLVDNGYQEAITFSFSSPHIQEMLLGQQNPISLINPISADLSVMRLSLWSGLVPAAAFNVNRQQSRVRLFECGLRFSKDKSDVSQIKSIAGIATGPELPEQWGVVKRNTDFFDVKGNVESLLGLGSQLDEFTFEPAHHPALHPGQSARIKNKDNLSIGWVGILHPKLQDEFGFPNQVTLFELDVDWITQRIIPKFKSLSKFPTVKRDLAILLDRQIGGGAIIDFIKHAEIDIISDATIFDVYSGTGVPDNLKSVAISLNLQDPFGTLTDERVETAMELLVGKLKSKFNAALRE